jgi:hypothetical protein
VPFLLLVIAACDIPAVTRVQAVCKRIIRALCSLSMDEGSVGFLADHAVRELASGLQGVTGIRLSAFIILSSALPWRVSIVRDMRQGRHYDATTFQRHVPTRLMTAWVVPLLGRRLAAVLTA